MTRPLRKDAADRRTALLRAAAEVFAEDGIDAPLERIAERAGVGRATLYRNFPGRTEIAVAVLIEDIEDLGRRFATPVSPDAFIDFVVALSAHLRDNAALGGVVRASPSAEILTPLRAAMMRAATPALTVSQAAGTVRGDLTPADMRVISAMLGAGLQLANGDERNAIADRTLELTLDALRSGARVAQP